ncbi:MAG: hypothetical protein D6798_02730 [Deltaproteobacteria bacterium]|nr:MAG: hypothetical protein D6798_02730 [Deltaproteobacteria bacterium]
MPHRLVAFLPLGLGLVLLGGGCSKEPTAPDTVDALQPSLTVDSPAPASWLPVGSTPVSGTSEDCRTVRIAGVDATLDDGGNFAGQVDLERGVNVVEVRALTLDGDELFVRNGVLAGDFDHPGGAVADAAIVRLNQGGLDKLLAMVGEMIEPSLINDSLSDLNPVYEDSYSILGWDAVEIAADLDSISFGPIQLSATPGSGRVVLAGSIPDLFVDAQATGEVVGVDFDSDVTLWADSADFSGTLTLGTADGRLTADVSDLRIDLVGFGYDTSLLPGDIEAYILVDTLQATIEEQVLAMLDETLPAYVDDALSGLDLSFSTELMSTPLSAGAEFAWVDTDGSGIEFGLDLDVDMPDAGLSGQGVLSAGDASPYVDRDADLAAAISDNLLNRMLYEAWSAGLLELRMSTDDDSLDPFLLTPLHATQGTITVRADLPPVVVQGADGLEAQVGELIVDIDTPDGEFGTHLQIAAAVAAGVDLSYADGEVALDLGEVGVTLMVRESDWGASNEAVTRLVEEMLPIDVMLALLGNLSFPIPSIDGLELESVGIDRASTGVHTSITANLR